MSGEPSTSKSAKRATRRPLSELELEYKRTRGEASCAECRRLKLRCDKEIPCGACKRRGCADSCPHGSKEHRIFLKETEASQKIADMGERIRQLEDALAVFQLGVSDARHPLLSDDKLLAIKFGNATRPTEGSDTATGPQAVADAGILAVQEGQVKYYGANAGSELFLEEGTFDEDHDHTDQYYRGGSDGILPSLIPPPPEGACSFGEVSSYSSVPECLTAMVERLPPYHKATSLIEVYLDHLAWHFRPIKKQELLEDFIIPIYKVKNGERDAPPLKPHSIAVLFFFFACSALFDLTLSPHNNDAHEYYLMGKKALTIRSVFAQTELETVQAVLLMAMYQSLEGHRYSIDSAWCVLSLACKLGQRIGLHRDPKRWNLTDKVADRRRNLFWEMAMQEVSHSLTLGRPPSTCLGYADCGYPVDEEATTDQETGKLTHGYFQAKFTYVKTLFYPLVDSTLSARTNSYKVVLDLDRQVRELCLPSCKPFTPESIPLGGIRGHMKRYSVSQYHPTAMIYLHRMHFAQSLIDFPDNPLRGPYAPSALAAYRYSALLIKTTAKHYEGCQDLMGRFWSVWTNTFSAAIVVGSIVTRAPTSEMAATAFIELGNALELLEKGSQVSGRAAAAVPVIRRLKEKGFEALMRVQNGVPGTIQLGDEDDELKVFAGHSRVLARKSPSPTVPSGPSLGNPQSSEPTDVEQPGSPWPDLHPSVLRYLSDDPLTNMGQRTTDATLLAWFQSCDPPGVPTYDSFNGESMTIPQLTDEENLGPLTLGNTQNLAPSNVNEQWQAFLRQFDIIDADTNMEDIMIQHDSYPYHNPMDAFH